ncbi:glycosyltransferase family 4 protein [Yoonia vestfoldensis]|uniref:glycosyltransferase family 4 protein n=1 Tax=Yoonia vestfoldensis TaxID=245188 RepID=UPI000362A256|nr:glycosyltransferase family 4 protein [Yoonia vestfoldensis]
MKDCHDDRMRIGMFVDMPEPEPDPDGVFGRDIAVDGVLDAVAGMAPPSDLCLFYNSPFLAPKTVDFGPLCSRMSRNPQAGHRLEHADIRALKQNFAQWRLTHFHDLDGNLQSAHDLRDRFADRLIPITATPHVFSYPQMAHSWIARMLLRPGFPCDAMICPTQSARKAFLNLTGAVADALRQSHGLDLAFKPQTPVIPLGVDTNRFRPRDKTALRRQLGLPEDVLLITWIGRLSAMDKADLLPLIDVFADMCRAPGRPSLRLLIGGSGNAFTRQALCGHAAASGVGDQILFRAVPARDRHLFHAASDIFVSLVDSVQETFGITPIEAMACGVPQIVSDWDGYRETVIHGVTGFRIPTYIVQADEFLSAAAGVYDGFDMFEHLAFGQQVVVDPDAMRQCLDLLVDNPELRRQMGEAARTRAVTTYDWSVVVAQYFELWTELSGIAAVTTWHKCADYDGQNLSRIFAHYASRVLPRDTVIALTEKARAARLEKRPVPAYFATAGLHSVPVLRVLLQALQSGPRSMVDLTALTCAQSGCTQETAIAHIMWLLKMGYCRPQADDARPDTRLATASGPALSRCGAVVL